MDKVLRIFVHRRCVASPDLFVKNIFLAYYFLLLLFSFYFIYIFLFILFFTCVVWFVVNVLYYGLLLCLVCVCPFFFLEVDSCVEFYVLFSFASFVLSFLMQGVADEDELVDESSLLNGVEQRAAGGAGAASALAGGRGGGGGSGGSAVRERGNPAPDAGTFCTGMFMFFMSDHTACMHHKLVFHAGSYGMHGKYFFHVGSFGIQSERQAWSYLLYYILLGIYLLGTIHEACQQYFYIPEV